jgi:hypothetical protein
MLWKILQRCKKLVKILHVGKEIIIVFRTKMIYRYFCNFNTKKKGV